MSHPVFDHVYQQPDGRLPRMRAFLCEIGTPILLEVHMRFLLQRCCFCQLPVLELTGQSDFLDTYYLQAQDEALAAHAYGACHVRCLLASPWGSFWARRRAEQHHHTRGQPIVGRVVAYTALRNINTGSTLIFADSGQFWSLADNQLNQVQPATGGVVVRHDHREYNLHLAGFADVAAAIRAELLVAKRFPLPRLIAMLGISEQMIHPDMLAKGELRFERGLQQFWLGDSLTIHMSYAEFVPDEVFALAQRAAATRWSH